MAELRYCPKHNFFDLHFGHPVCQQEIQTSCREELWMMRMVDWCFSESTVTRGQQQAVMVVTKKFWYHVLEERVLLLRGGNAALSFIIKGKVVAATEEEKTLWLACPDQKC